MDCSPLLTHQSASEPFHFHSYTDGRGIIRLTNQTAKFMDYSELRAIIVFSILFKDTSGCILKVSYSARPPILADSRSLSVLVLWVKGSVHHYFLISSKVSTKTLLGYSFPSKLSISSVDGQAGDRIMRWVVFTNDEQVLVSMHFNSWSDSTLISSSNDHFTVYCGSNCMFCSLGSSSPAEWKSGWSLFFPSWTHTRPLSNSLSFLLLWLCHWSQFG